MDSGVQINWNNYAFAQLAKSEPVREALQQEVESRTARANAIAEEHLGALKIDAPQGGRFNPDRFTVAPYAGHVATGRNTAIGSVGTHTKLGALDQNQFQTLDSVAH